MASAHGQPHGRPTSPPRGLTSWWWWWWSWHPSGGEARDQRDQGVAGGSANQSPGPPEHVVLQGPDQGRAKPEVRGFRPLPWVGAHPGRSRTAGGSEAAGVCERQRPSGRGVVIVAVGEGVSPALHYRRNWPAPGSVSEKGVDVELATDVVRLALLKRLDAAIVVTSDNDLMPAVETLYESRLARTWSWRRGRVLLGCGSRTRSCRGATT